ncbi:MAG: Asp-tRNA(Asn)/Glu-tRNA(Gln) amidotransferase subunit GatB, partial [Chlamydiota bacterium]
VVDLTRAHMEEDAGKSVHEEGFIGPHGEVSSGIDLNRAGTPLLEIVTEPIMHSAKEAIACVMAIKATMEYIGASDGNMEEGSLRVDANVSVRLRGESQLRPKTEIKNMNSFSLMEMAITSEIQRQIKLYTKHSKEEYSQAILAGTYRWDSDKKETVLMRRKETADDYRYFPEPDLGPIILEESFIASLKKSLPELPEARYNRYISTLGLTPYSASTLVCDKRLSDYFEEGLTFCSNPKALCNWITIEFAGRVKEKSTTLFALGLSSKNIATLVHLIDQGIVTGKIAKMVADDMVAFPMKDCETIIKENPNYQPITSTESIEPFVDQVLKENPQSVIDYRAGKTKVIGFLMGQVMKLTQGKSSPQVVNELIKKKLES